MLTNRKQTLILLLLLTVVLSACSSKIEKIMLVVTDNYYNVEPRSAMADGTITDIGSNSVQYGHVFGTESGVTIVDRKSELGVPPKPGHYTSKLTNLRPDTRYYVRAYITDGVETVYGEEITFLTPEKHQKSSFTDTRDNKTYNTVKIGTQWWFAENLAWLPAVSPSSDGSETNPRYYVYDYQGTNVSSAKATQRYIDFGVLYNWQAALTACPDGWHLPDNDDYQEFEDYLTENGYNFDRSITGNKMAVALVDVGTNWQYSPSDGAPGNNGWPEMRNISEFAAKPGGARGHEGTYWLINTNFLLWSATDNPTSTTHTRMIWHGGAGFNKDSMNKTSGLSVRCIKDQ